MIQAIIKCFERSTVERIEENSNDVSSGVQLYVHKFGHGEMRNKKVENRKKKTALHKNGSSALLNIALEKEGKKKKKKVITTRGIRIWSPIQVLSPPNS